MPRYGGCNDCDSLDIIKIIDYMLNQLDLNQ